MAKSVPGKINNFKKKVVATTLVGFLGAASPAYALPVNSGPVPEKNKSKVSLILGARKGFGKSGLYGGEFGIGVGRFALVGSLGSGPDLNLQDTEENVFGNVYFQGREDLKNSSYFGGALEYHQPGKGVSWVIGAGGGLEKVTREIEENLVRGETVLASNTTSTPEKKFAGYVYTGPKFPITKNMGLNLNVGYKTGREKGVFVNLRAIFRFPGKKGDR